MLLFIILLIVLGLLTTLFSISLADKKWKEAVLLLSISVLPIAAYPVVSRIDMGLLKNIATDVSMLNALTLLMIFEGLIGMWLGMSVIKSHYYGNTKRKKHVNLFYLPSLSVAGAVILGTYFAMMKISGVNYFVISVAVAGVVFITLFFASILTKAVIKSWSQRLELRMILTIASIVCASYIPVFFNDYTFKGVYEPQKIYTVLLFGSVSIFMISQGILFNLIMTRYRRRKLTNGNS